MYKQRRSIWCTPSSKSTRISQTPTRRTEKLLLPKFGTARHKGLDAWVEDKIQIWAVQIHLTNMALSKQLNLGWNHATPRLLRSTEILKLCRCLTRSASNVQIKAEKLLGTQPPNYNIWNRAEKTWIQRRNQLHLRGSCLEIFTKLKTQGQERAVRPTFPNENFMRIGFIMRAEQWEHQKDETVIAVAFVALGKGFLACSAQATNRFSCLLCTGTHWWIDALLCAGSFFYYASETDKIRPDSGENWRRIERSR